MKRLSFAFVLLLLFSSCLSPKEALYRSIPMEEAAAIIESGEEYILLDVRTEEEYRSGHIPGAVNLPLSEISSSSSIPSLPQKDALILVYCRSGNRSKQASEKLAGMGYSNIIEIGGINSWKGDVVVE